jgi:hypothetical protein
MDPPLGGSTVTGRNAVMIGEPTEPREASPTLYDAEALYTQNMQALSLWQAEYYEQRLSKAQARYLAAIRTLAQVRRLGVPTVQVNKRCRSTSGAGQHRPIAGDRRVSRVSAYAGDAGGQRMARWSVLCVTRRLRRRWWQRGKAWHDATPACGRGHRETCWGTSTARQKSPVG